MEKGICLIERLYVPYGQTVRFETCLLYTSRCVYETGQSLIRGLERNILAILCGVGLLCFAVASYILHESPSQILIGAVLVDPTSIPLVGSSKRKISTLALNHFANTAFC